MVAKIPGYENQDLATVPRVTTETGTTINNDVDEDMHSKLLTNLYLAQYKRGYSYTAIYLLRDRSDEEGNQTFGFYNPDYQPRQAAHYLHNLTTILTDNRQAATPEGSIPYMINGNSETIHDMLLRKSNGNYFLVIWGENYKSKAENIIIQFKKQYKTIKIYDVKQSCDAIETHQNTDAVSLSIKDEIKILEIETSENVSNENISSNIISDFYYLPQSDNLYFTCPQYISSVNIINIHGQTCSKKEHPNRYIALKYLQPGIYIIHCQLSNGHIISKRIIK